MINLTIHSKDLNGQSTKTINANDLWTSLSINTPYHKWITRRIENYGFLGGEDFLKIEPNSSFLRGRPKAEYFISLDMAKELALLENNEQGRKIRKELIEAERKLREDVPAILRKLQTQNQRLIQSLIRHHPYAHELVRYCGAKLSQREILKLLDMHHTTLKRYLIELTEVGLIDYKPNAKMQALAYKSNQARLNQHVVQ